MAVNDLFFGVNDLFLMERPRWSLCRISGCDAQRHVAVAGHRGRHGGGRVPTAAVTARCSLVLQSWARLRTSPPRSPPWSWAGWRSTRTTASRCWRSRARGTASGASRSSRGPRRMVSGGAGAGGRVVLPRGPSLGGGRGRGAPPSPPRAGRLLPCRAVSQRPVSPAWGSPLLLSSPDTYFFSQVLF